MTPARSLSDAERRDWLRLARTQSIGPVTFARLLKRFGSASAALSALLELAQKAGRKRPLVAPTASAIEDEIAATQKYGAHIVASCEADYPPLLKAVAPPPPVLTMLGKAHCFHRGRQKRLRRWPKNRARNFQRAGLGGIHCRVGSSAGYRW